MSLNFGSDNSGSLPAPNPTPAPARSDAIGTVRVRRRKTPEGNPCGDNIQLIKEVRSLTGWSLYDTKVRVVDLPEFTTDRATAERLLGTGCFEAPLPYGMTSLGPEIGPIIFASDIVEGIPVVWTDKSATSVGATTGIAYTSSNKILAIKELCVRAGLGLREAKDLLEGGPFPASPGVAHDLVKSGHFAYALGNPDPTTAPVPTPSTVPASDPHVLVVWRPAPGHSNNKIPPIKALREAMGFGIREAKDLLEGGLPFTVTREQAISLVQSGHFTAVKPITPVPAPPTVGAGLDPNTLNDIRALVFLARIGFGSSKPTLDAGNVRFIEETIDRLTQY